MGFFINFLTQILPNRRERGSVPQRAQDTRMNSGRRRRIHAAEEGGIVVLATHEFTVL